MKLSFEKIKEITKGAVRVTSEDKYVRFYRFTEEQGELYKERFIDFYHQSLFTAGVKLEFNTDSKNLFLKVNVPEITLRKYFSFDVLVNGKPVGYISNFVESDMPDNYIDVDFPMGEYSKSFELGEGTKKVSIYFPWSVIGELEELSLDDGSFCESVPCEKKILVFGNSITQGYDAQRPSNHHIVKLAELLNVEVVNKAIAGERFFSDLAKTVDDINPEFITVAYGTNDWDNVEKQELLDTCRGFYENLSHTYSNTKIFAISPIWRVDENEERKCGKFSDVEKDIKEIVNNLPNITFVSGYKFVPCDKKYYADHLVHPNDKGFEYYISNMYEQIKNKY